MRKEGDVMFALFVILNDTNYLDDVLAGFVEVGVSGATILDSQGMASAIVHGNNQEIPLFGSLQTLLGNSYPYNKTIFTVLENEELVEKVVKSIREVIGEEDKNNAGFMFTVPIGKVYDMGK